MEEYGSRIVKSIKAYVEKEGLQKKREMSSNVANNRLDQATVIEIGDDDDGDGDEFECGIDYSCLDLG